MVSEQPVGYDVISDIDLSELVRRVNEAHAKGWRPQGGICVVLPHQYSVAVTDENNYVLTGCFYHQAMIKADSEASKL